MYPAIDQDDTQVLDFDSPHSGGSDCFLGGETLPLDYGETQQVDNCDGQHDGGFQDWGKTQVIDKFEETEVIRDDNEDGGEVSEKTELVTNDKDFVDDFGEEVGSAVKTKDADLVAPDASTDEEEGCGNDEPGNLNLEITEASRTGMKASLMETIPFSFSLNQEKFASQSPLRFSQAAAGLSYIASQEPGIQSQTIALGIVDKFLLVNNEGLSQDISNENVDTVISPPIASLKRAQGFVSKSDKSTAGKAQVYDWIDSLEDEGGGELFSRIQNFFFDDKRRKPKSCVIPSKIMPKCSKMMIAADNKCSNGDAKSRSCWKLESLAKSMKKQTTTESVEQFEKSVVHVSHEDAYDVGPATQMAVEAIQALGHSSPLELINLQSKHEEVTGTSTKMPLHRLKQQSEESKSQTISCKSARKHPTRSRAKMVLKGSTLELTAKINNGECAAPMVGETMKKMVDEEADNSSVPMTHFKPLSVMEMYTSPVAHRTRRAKSTKLLNPKETLSNGFCEDLNAHRVVVAVNEFESNTLVASKINENGCSASLNGTIKSDHGFTDITDAVEIERVHVGETEVSHDKDEHRQFKRRKLNEFDSENQKSDGKMSNLSKSTNVITTTALKSTNQKKHKVFIRSVAEILDTVKRKKRSVSSSSKFGSDGLPSNVGKMPSLLSDILKPYFSNDSRIKTGISCKPASDGISNTHSISYMKHLVNHDNLETSKKCVQSGLPAEVVKENGKPEGSLDTVCQSGLPCLPTTITNAASPVCNSEDGSRISVRKSLSRSPLSRELTRLETSYTSPSKLNDVRRRKDISFQVCFSNHLSQAIINQQKRISKRLGLKVVSSSLEATHFVADKFVRTRNMLEAMAKGKPVITPMWLKSCGQANSYIDEKNYILRDAKKEKEIGFSMPISLARACQHPLLQRKRVFITRNARPDKDVISSLVKAAGGQPLNRIEISVTEECKLPEDLIILAGEEDFSVCAPLLEKGAAVYSSELLLNGIVIQKLEYERHQLFLKQVKKC